MELEWKYWSCHSETELWFQQTETSSIQKQYQTKHELINDSCLHKQNQ